MGVELNSILFIGYSLDSSARENDNLNSDEALRTHIFFKNLSSSIFH